MARFYGEIQGSRGEATRMGTRESGFRGHIRGWHIGAAVEMYAEGDASSTLLDRAVVYATDGSAGYARSSIGSLRLVDGEIELTPSAWTIKQVEQYKRRESARLRREARANAKQEAARRKRKLREAWQFFHEHAGYVVGRRAIGAMSLARAEALFEDADAAGLARIRWEDDPYADASWLEQPEFARELEQYRDGDMSCESALLEVREDEDEPWQCVGSLGGIFDADDDYRRVVNAELASEALADIRRVLYPVSANAETN